MKYLRLFETNADYQSYIENENNHVEPHIALLRGNKTCHYKKYFNALSEINGILENIISRTDKPLDINILNKIDKSNQDFTDINNQLEEIILSGYEPLENPENYLTFEALKSGMRVSFSNNCQYSLGTNEWFDLQSGELTPMVKKGQKIYFKATGLVPNSSKGIGTFTITGNCNLLGNCNSMLFGDDAETNLSLSGKNHAFYKLFYNCSTIIDASQLILPATTLATYCYRYMFYGCSSLVNAPELPATTLDTYCYQYMFQNCTSLVNTPELPATTLVANCYDYMFSGCSSLVTAPELPATTLATYCYQYMFSGCSSLVNAPELPATTLSNGCYISMFHSCRSLTTAPELPATTLAASCYNSMFTNCTSLTKAPELPATTLANSCYYYMLSGTNVLPDCTNIDFTSESVLSSGGLRGLFAGTKVTDEDLYNILPINQSTGKYWLPSTTLVANCYQYMFSGCSSLVNAPELPATTLATYCYRYMFSGCSSLVNAPELPATTLDTYCYQYMFQNCTSLVNAPELPATTLVKNCYEYMFSGCSKLNYIKALFTTTPSSTYTSNWVYGVSPTGTFVKSANATWDVTGYVGIPTGWDVQIAFTPIRCINLSITADDVFGRSTNTNIYWTAEVEGVDDVGNNMTVTFTGTDTSESFPQNTSTTDTIERTISYTYMGVTATTTITQGIWIDCSYTINLNNQWQSSSVVNPDSSLYDGVYESFSNKGVNSTAATMYIDINGYTDFDLYIRSYAESNHDYVMVSQLDQTIDNNTLYSNTTLVKEHTRGNSKSGTSIDNYTKVSFTGIDGGQHRITIVYRKDSSGYSGDDRGYILIPKNQ